LVFGGPISPVVQTPYGRVAEELAGEGTAQLIIAEASSGLFIADRVAAGQEDVVIMLAVTNMVDPTRGIVAHDGVASYGPGGRAQTMARDSQRDKHV
jgi:hypothetical protein